MPQQRSHEPKLRSRATEINNFFFKERAFCPSSIPYVITSTCNSQALLFLLCIRCSSAVLPKSAPPSRLKDPIPSCPLKDATPSSPLKDITPLTLPSPQSWIFHYLRNLSHQPTNILLLILSLKLQEYLWDIAGLVPNHQDKAHLAIKPAITTIWFPSAYKSYVCTIHSLLSGQYHYVFRKRKSIP